MDSVTNFLYHNPKGKIQFPDSTIYIGTGFEIGGTYEDWGFGVYQFQPSQKDEKTGQTLFTKKLIAEGRTIEQAINKAIQYYKDKDYDKTVESIVTS